MTLRELLDKWATPPHRAVDLEDLKDALASNAEAYIELWEAADDDVQFSGPARLAQAVEALRPLMEGGE